jgi:hypothetical protein
MLQAQKKYVNANREKVQARNRKRYHNLNADHIECPLCGRIVMERGLYQHMKNTKWCLYFQN